MSNQCKTAGRGLWGFDSGYTEGILRSRQGGVAHRIRCIAEVFLALRISVESPPLGFVPLATPSRRWPHAERWPGRDRSVDYHPPAPGQQGLEESRSHRPEGSARAHAGRCSGFVVPHPRSRDEAAVARYTGVSSGRYTTRRPDSYCVGYQSAVLATGRSGYSTSPLHSGRPSPFNIRAKSLQTRHNLPGHHR